MSLTLDTNVVLKGKERGKRKDGEKTKASCLFLLSYLSKVEKKKNKKTKKKNKTQRKSKRKAGAGVT
jgi:hypothetical protein